MAKDIRAARGWYTELIGYEPYFHQPDKDNPAYIEFRLGDYQHELGITNIEYAPKNSVREPGGAVAYWHVDDINTMLKKLLDMGSTAFAPVTNQRDSGFITASVIDPFGNVLGIMQNPHYLEILGAGK